MIYEFIFIYKRLSNQWGSRSRDKNATYSIESFMSIYKFNMHIIYDVVIRYNWIHVISRLNRFFGHNMQGQKCLNLSNSTKKSQLTISVGLNLRFQVKSPQTISPRYKSLKKTRGWIFLQDWWTLVGTGQFQWHSRIACMGTPTLHMHQNKKIIIFQIYMKNPESAEQKEKSNFRFFPCLFFEL